MLCWSDSHTTTQETVSREFQARHWLTDPLTVLRFSKLVGVARAVTIKLVELEDVLAGELQPGEALS
jgi:hypothetical protein